jgi:DinB superfamily
MSELVESVRAVLESNAKRWLAFAEMVPEDLLGRPPAAGEWSATACLQHLVDTERWVFPTRLRAFLEGSDIQAFDPDGQGSGDERSAGDLAAEFARLRAESLELLAQVGQDDVNRTSNHSELGPVQLREMLNEWAAHDLNHTIQAERALMQVFISGSGPWRHYFVEHEVK